MIWGLSAYLIHRALHKLRGRPRKAWITCIHKHRGHHRRYPVEPLRFNYNAARVRTHLVHLTALFAAFSAVLAALSEAPLIAKAAVVGVGTDALMYNLAHAVQHGWLRGCVGRTNGWHSAMCAFHRTHHWQPNTNFGVSTPVWDVLFDTAQTPCAPSNWRQWLALSVPFFGFAALKNQPRPCRQN